LTGKMTSTWRQSYPSVILANRELRWNDPGSKPGFCGDRTKNNSRSHEMELVKCNYIS